MKRSRFAVCEKLDEGCAVLYSYSTGGCLIADPQLLECFESGVEDPDGFLSAMGILVDDGRDELDEQRQLFEASRRDTEALYLCLAPTYACNCKCVYCYEQDKATAKSLMSPEVERGIYEFVERRFAEAPFRRLDVQWYGGDPSMALGHVERMSEWFMAFCAEHDADYSAMMLSNCARITEDDVDMLARCGVSKLLITIDGPETTHNLRRPAVGVDNPFQHIKSVIILMRDAGIQTECICNTDKVNAKLLPALKEELRRDCDVEITPAKLNDYARSYGCGTFAAPEFDLFDHEEYAHAMFDIVAADNPAKDSLLGLLAPSCRFCKGQSESYFVIDSYGDVYKCDGWMGDTSRAVGNLLADGEIPAVISFDPFEQQECVECELLPVCWGNCSWERERCGWPCHPLKHTQGKYLRLLAERL